MTLGVPEAPQSRLVAMLDLVPQDVLGLATGWAHVRYVDYAALFASEGLSAIRDVRDLELILTSVPLGSLLGRIAAGPQALQYLFSSAGRMAEVVGFEWLTHVDRSLEFGEPPAVGLVLEGPFDTGAIAAALAGRGFEQRTVNGVEVWHRFDDWTVNLTARELADPFGGHLGAAARIAVLPATLLSGRGWGIVEAGIAASQGEISSLGDDAGHRALVEVLAGADYPPIQALLFPGPALRVHGEDWPADDLSDRLAPYLLAGLADRQEGDDQVHVIGLVYPDADNARAASEVLHRRIQAFALPQAPQEPLVERFGAAVTPAVIQRPQEGLSVAVVEVRYPLPYPRLDAQTGMYTVGGQLYRLWVQAILMRAFSALW
ncbi:MAG: hypothetical protein ACP5G2_04760 [Candidatus Bipolaricaulaceae bacterium]